MASATSAETEAQARHAAQTGAGAAVEALIDNGIDLVFGYPGGAIMPIYDALHAARNRLRHVLVRHEQGAAHAAEGYARATLKPGVCMGTSGPGATNLLTGLADALMDSTPIIAITGQVPSPMLGTDAFQEADVVGMSLAATKWSYQVTDPNEVAWAIREALAIAMSGRPGPVLIDITKDAQINPITTPRVGTLRPITSPDDPPRSFTSTSEPLEPFEDAIARATTLLDTAHRPLLLAGHGILLARAQAELSAFVEKSGIPCASTLLGLSALHTEHPLYVGMLGMHGSYAPNILTNEADVIVAVGMRFDDRVTGRLDGYAPGAKIVHIDIDPAEIGKNVPTEVGIVRDAKVALAALTLQISARTHTAWRAKFTALDEEEHAAVTAPFVESPAGMLSMIEVIKTLSDLTEGQATIVSDVGQHQMHAARHYAFKRPNTHVTSGGSGTMGFALPAAIGATYSGHEQPVIAVVGDGGFQMNIQELGTLMQERIPVKIVILNNEYLGMVRQWQQLFFDGRYSEVEMSNPDFVRICEGYRIPAERVTGRDELAAAIQRMVDADGPYLLDIAVAKEENVFPMIPAGDAVDQIRLS